MSEQDPSIKWAGIVIVKDRKVLTLKESDKPFQLVPGGKVEDGETDEEAVVREVNEELGVKMLALSSVALATIIKESKSTGQLIRFKVFTGELDEEPDTGNLPGKTEALMWIDSSYEEKEIEVGNLLTELVPILVERNLID